MKILTKKLKEKWIKALRGGEYEQGKMDLHNLSDNTYCCLGVLAEIGDIVTVGNSYLDKNDRSCVKGLTIRNQTVLAEMNDAGKTFKTIANWIEKYINPKQ